jgi:hypothetical protein
MSRPVFPHAAPAGLKFSARFGTLLLLLLLAASPLVARKETSPSLRIDVQVLSPTGDPVPNAGVVLRQICDLRGKKVKDSVDVELKSDQNGKAGLDGFVEGKVLVQVIAHGLRTFGKVYTIHARHQNIVVHLQAPAGQISIYH